MAERNGLDAYDRPLDRYLGEDRSAAIAAADVSEREHFAIFSGQIELCGTGANRRTPAFLKVPTCE